MKMMVVDPAGTGENLVRLRKDAKLKVRDLQAILGFASPQAIYKWQKGEALPSVDHLVILAGALEVPVDHILATKVLWSDEADQQINDLKMKEEK